MASLFAVGLPFTYDGTTNHFATTSGGTATVAAVTSADTVIVDSLSGNATLTIGAAWSCTALTINNANATVACDATHGITASGAVTVTTGTLNTNGQTCTWGFFSSTNSNTRSITLGASAIAVTGNSNASWNINNSFGATLSMASATITFSGASAGIASASKTYGSIVVTSSTNAFWIQGSNNTFANFTQNGPVNKIGTLNPTGSQTITGILTLAGNATTNRLFVSTFNSSLGAIPGNQVTFTVNGSVVLSNVDFMDIKSAGSAGTWTGTSLGDCLGNSGITFTTAAPQTWNGNTTGAWSTAANWTSRVPLPQDNASVTGLTSGTITIDMPRLGANVDFTGSTGGTISWTTNSSIFGNWTLVTGITDSGVLGQSLRGRGGTYTFKSGGVSYGHQWIVNTPTGTYQLLDDYTSTATNAYALNPQLGTFDANGYNVNTYSFANSGTNPTTLMGSGTWTINGTDQGGRSTWFNITSGTIQAQTSTIILSDTGATAKTFAGGGSTYNNLTISSDKLGSIIITGSNKFNILTINSPNNIFFANGSTTTCNQLVANGANSGDIVWRSTVNNYQANINVLQGYSVSNVDLRDSNASGSAILP